MRSIVLLLLALVPAAYAQTRPDARQIKAPPTPPVTVLVFQSGRAVLATLGPGLTLDTTASPPQIRAVAAAPDFLRLSKSGSGWPLGASCAKVAVYRNGIRQLEAEDYQLTAGIVTFRSGAASSDDPSEPPDIVVAECWK